MSCRSSWERISGRYRCRYRNHRILLRYMVFFRQRSRLRWWRKHGWHRAGATRREGLHKQFTPRYREELVALFHYQVILIVGNWSRKLACLCYVAAIETETQCTVQYKWTSWNSQIENNHLFALLSIIKDRDTLDFHIGSTRSWETSPEYIPLPIDPCENRTRWLPIAEWAIMMRVHGGKWMTHVVIRWLCQRSLESLSIEDNSTLKVSSKRSCHFQGSSRYVHMAARPEDPLQVPEIELRSLYRLLA